MSAEGCAEVWRQVVGWEGLYEVSSEGRLRSCDRVQIARNRWGPCKMTFRGKLLRPAINTVKGVGYRRTMLCDGGRRITVPVHSMVAAAFLGPRPQGMHIAHINGDSLDNRASNLRYATPADNEADKAKHGRVAKGDKNGEARLTEEQVRAIRAARGTRTQHELAREYGVHQTTISLIQTYKKWTHI